MLTLTQAISLPQITKFYVKTVVPNEEGSAAAIRVAFVGDNGRSYGEYVLSVRNSGKSTGVRLKSAPKLYSDALENFDLDLTDAFDGAMAAFDGKNYADKLAGLEAWLVQVGLVPAAAPPAKS